MSTETLDRVASCAGIIDVTERNIEMPSSPMAHICLLVEDLDKAIDDWQKILKVLDPGQLEEPIVRYDDFEGGDDEMRWVTFVANHGAEIQLCEPAPDTPMGRRLAKHGESVHHICFTTPDVPAAARELADEGLSVDADHTYSDPTLPWQEWTWIMPDSAHGVLVEVARPYKAVDGKWADGTQGA
jgi:methylmalonyl-CoA/ethylmalonyl-CoA epimerase